MRYLGLVLVLCFCAVADDDRTERIERLLQAGEASYLKADYEAAHKSYEDAWQIAEETAPADPARYKVLKHLTAVRAAAGEYADAETYLQQALTWRENQFGPSDSQAIDDLLDVANLCRRMKDFERALVVLERVQTLHTARNGRESIPVADDLSRRAQVLIDWKKPEQAVSMLGSAIALRAQLNGADHPTLLSDVDLLGQTNNSLRRYDAAEDSFRRALVIRERLFGRESADLIATLDGLAYALYGQKKYDQAEVHYRRLLEVWMKSAGPDHPMIATVLDKMAGLYADQQKWDQANESVEKANAVRAHFMAVGLAQAGGLRLMAGDMDAAKKLYQQALAVMDPQNPLFDELRAQVEKNLKVFEPAPKPRASKAAPKKKD